MSYWLRSVGGALLAALWAALCWRRSVGGAVGGAVLAALWAALCWRRCGRRCVGGAVGGCSVNDAL
jgi:hypothetical protein